MTPLETRLTDALLAGERLLADYVEPNSDRPAIIDQLVHLSTARSSARRKG
jgi:hypothetical protein